MASLAYKERLSENLTSELRQQIRKAEGTEDEAVIIPMRGKGNFKGSKGEERIWYISGI